MKYTVSSITLEHLDTVWEKVSPYIVQAMNMSTPGTTETELQAVKEYIKDEDYQLWIITDENLLCVCAFTTCFHDFRDERILVINYLGATDFESYGREAMAGFETEVKNQGIDRIRIIGRKGWSKLFDGYSHQSTIIEKIL